MAQESVYEHGISESQLKNDVELKLRMAGISIPDEYGSMVFGTLGIFVNSTDGTDSRTRMYSVQVCLFENMESDRLDNAFVITWMAKSGGYQSNMSDVSYSNFIRDDIKDLVDYFINDYLRDNPK